MISQGNPNKQNKTQTLVNFIYSTDVEKLQMICSEHLC